MRQEAPGAPLAAAPSITATVTGTVRWRAMGEPFPAVVGGKRGLVSGETLYNSTVEISGTCTLTTEGCDRERDCARMVFESVTARVLIDVRYVEKLREHAAHEATHARQIRDAIQRRLERLQTPPDLFTCRNRTAAEGQRAQCVKRLTDLAPDAADKAQKAWKQERNTRYAQPNGYRNDPAEQEAFAAGEDKAADIAARQNLTAAQREAAMNAELTFPAGINPPVEFGGEPPPAPARSRRR